RFSEFEAEFTHSDALGGALTSLIQAVNTHTLAHDVIVDHAPGDEQIRDFLALEGGDNPDPDFDTYRVYESTGVDTEVLKVFSDTLWTGPSFSFSTDGAVGPIYARQRIGFDGQALTISGTHNGATIHPENVWFSKRRAGESWIYFVNLFEANPG